MSSSSSPSKKHYSTQHKEEQDAEERVRINGVLERNSHSRDADPSSTDVQLQLHLLLRNVGSKVRKSVTEGYPTSLPTHSTICTSPSKDDARNIHSPFTSPQRASGPQDQVFTSSKDILRSVYAQDQPCTVSPSPKKRVRTQDYTELSEEEEDENEESNEKEQIEMDFLDCLSLGPLRATSNRTIKPLPFRLSQTRLNVADRGFSASSSEETTAVPTTMNDDPFSAPHDTFHDSTTMDTCILEQFKDSVKV